MKRTAVRLPDATYDRLKALADRSGPLPVGDMSGFAGKSQCAPSISIRRVDCCSQD